MSDFAASDFTQFALNVMKAKHCPVHAEIVSRLVFFSVRCIIYSLHLLMDFKATFSRITNLPL